MTLFPPPIQQDAPSLSPASPGLSLTWVSMGLTFILMLYALLYQRDAHPYASWVREVFHFITLGAACFLYWQGYRRLATQQQPVSFRTLLAYALPLFILTLLIRPFYSSDVYGYINRGWQQVHFGLNPYVYTLAQTPHWQADPMLTAHWIHNPCPYGFLFAYYAKALCWFGQGSLLLTLWLFKLGNILAVGGIGYCVYRVHQSSSLSWAAASCYLLLFSPVILWQALANGHNDIIMVFWMALAFYWATRGKDIWVIPALTAAVLIKYAAVVTFPFAIVWLFQRKRWTGLMYSILLTGLVLLLCALPYAFSWQHFQWQQLTHNIAQPSYSLQYSILTVLHWVAWPFSMQQTQWVLSKLMWIGFVLYSMSCFIKRAKNPYSITQLVQDSVIVLCILVYSVSQKFYPWYVLMFWPLGLFLPPDNRVRLAMVYLSLFALFGFTFVVKSKVLNSIVLLGLPILLVLRGSAWGRLQRLKSKLFF